MYAQLEAELAAQKLKADAEKVEQERVRAANLGTHLANLSSKEHKAAVLKDVAEKQVVQFIELGVFKGALEERLAASDKSTLLLEHERLEKEGQDRLEEVRLERLASAAATSKRKEDRKADAKDRTPTQKVTPDTKGGGEQSDEVDYSGREEGEESSEEVNSSIISPLPQSIESEKDSKDDRLSEEDGTLEDLDTRVGEKRGKDKASNPFTTKEAVHPAFRPEYLDALVSLQNGSNAQAKLISDTYRHMSKAEKADSNSNALRAYNMLKTLPAKFDRRSPDLRKHDATARQAFNLIWPGQVLPKLTAK